jgi:hypothetical protein
VKKPIQRKVKTGDGGRSAIITTSSWRQGAALTRKVLANKTQENTSSTSITSETTSTKSSAVVKKDSEPVKISKKPKTPPKVTRKPRKIEKPPVEAPPKVKARHYNPSDVQTYIENTRKQRKEQMMAEKRKQIEAEKEKDKRLKELFDFQKKALKRCSVNPSSTPTPPQTKMMMSADSVDKIRATCSESSDKENVTIDEKSIPNIPLIPPSTSIRLITMYFYISNPLKYLEHLIHSYKNIFSQG